MHNIFGAADTGHSNGLEPLLIEFLGGFEDLEPPVESTV
jgi:hypothetical protein